MRDTDKQISRRIAVASTALDKAVRDVVRAAKRVATLRARIARLEAQARIPANERRERALRGAETRRAARQRRRGPVREIVLAPEA